MTWVAVAVVAAGTITAGVGAYSASKTNKALDKQGDVAQQQADFAREMLDQSNPLREGFIQQLQQFMLTGAIPPALTGYAGESPNLYGLDTFMKSGELPPSLRMDDVTAASRDTLEQQFARAKESTIGAAPTMGGHLADALTGLEGERAFGVTGITSADAERKNKLRQSLYGVGLDISREQSQRQQALRQGLFAQGIGAGWGTVGPAIQGFNSAGNQFGSIASTRLGATNSLADMFGTTVGYGLPAIQNANRQAGVKSDLQTEFINNPELY